MANVELLLDDTVDLGSRRALLTKIYCAAHSLVGLKVEPDTGPWEVSADGRTLSSDNFDHDVNLRIDGDFYDDASRVAYAKALAERINGATELPNGLPEEPPGGLLYSMALRYRHDFGLDRDPSGGPLQAGCTDDERRAILNTMRQLYEEVSGHGFFKWE